MWKTFSCFILMIYGQTTFFCCTVRYSELAGCALLGISECRLHWSLSGSDIFNIDMTEVPCTGFYLYRKIFKSDTWTASFLQEIDLEARRKSTSDDLSTVVGRMVLRITFWCSLSLCQMISCECILWSVNLSFLGFHWCLNTGNCEQLRKPFSLQARSSGTRLTFLRLMEVYRNLEDPLIDWFFDSDPHTI